MLLMRRSIIHLRIDIMKQTRLLETINSISTYESALSEIGSPTSKNFLVTPRSLDSSLCLISSALLHAIDIAVLTNTLHRSSPLS